jgi:hypothetical protein
MHTYTVPYRIQLQTLQVIVYIFFDCHKRNFLLYACNKFIRLQKWYEMTI